MSHNLGTHLSLTSLSLFSFFGELFSIPFICISGSVCPMPRYMYGSKMKDEVRQFLGNPKAARFAIKYIKTLAESKIKSLGRG